MAGKPISRVNDISVGMCSVGMKCCPHSWISTHSTGSVSTNADGLPVMRIGDIGSSTCPHCAISYAISGSTVTFADHKPVHLVGDLHIVPCGTGTCISGSHSTFSQ